MAKLFFRRGQLQGKSFSLKDQREVTIGRTKRCTIPVSDEQLSRRHCRIVYDGENYYLEDLKSRNGTFVNGKKVKKPVRLYSGDILVFGGQEVVFESQKESHFRPIPSLEGCRHDHFEVRRRLFSGPLFTWYLGYQSNLDRAVLLQALNPPYSFYPPLRKRVVEAAKKANQVRHPHLLEVLDVTLKEDQVWIWLERRDGIFLFDLLSKGCSSWAESLSIVHSTLEVLAALHRQGQVYGSLDAYSILVTEEGHSRLIPPGCSPWLLKVRLQGGHGDDLLPYAPPEVWRGERLHLKSDIYSLGVVWYRMATGRFPFQGKRRREFKEAHLHKPIPPASEIPEEAFLLLEAMMAKSPELRPSVEQLLPKVEELKAELPKAKQRSSRPREERRVRQYLQTVEEESYYRGGNLVLFLILLAALFWLTSQLVQVYLQVVRR